MLIDPSDPMDRAFYLGQYECHLIRFIADFVRPGDVCLDVGAQKGYIALHLAQAVGSGGKVIAIDADPRACGHLRRHAQQNHLDRLSIVECAVAESRGTCEFTISRQLGWSSRFMNNLAEPTAIETITTSKNTLDNIIAEQGIVAGRHRLTFVKIDAEGSEPLVLAGAQGLLRNFRPMLYLEINPESLKVAATDENEIFADLATLKYQVVVITPHRTGNLRITYKLTPRDQLGRAALPAFYEIVAFPEEMLRDHPAARGVLPYPRPASQ